MTHKEFEIAIFSLKDKIYRFAKKILNSVTEAEDVTQDMYEKLWKMKDDLHKYTSIEGFVIKTTKNICLDRLKHEKVKADKMGALYSASNIESVPSLNQDNQEKAQLIKSAIHELPEKQKLIIHLRDVEGYEFKEIQAVMDMNIDAIRMNLSRARKAVKEKVEKTLSYGL